MGRRTVWWRATAAAGAALCATAVPQGQAAAAGTPDPYAFAEDAVAVQGTTTTTGAARLAAGKTYRSSIRPGETLYYRLELDAATDAYVSATTVPEPGTTVTQTEGVKVTVQDADGHRCSSETARFGPTRSPRPVTAWAGREIGSDPYMCQEGGTYYVVVERAGTAASSPGAQGEETEEGDEDDGAAWGLELTHVLEPPLKKAGGTTAPETWSSESPEVLTGDSRPRDGGAGFSTASAVGQGVWEEKGGIRAGQTLYYRVPVDWGRQLYVTAELGSADEDGGFVGSALALSLYNPVRGLVDDVTSSYDGRQRSTALDPLPPVRYENRFAVDDEVSGMRFAGWYYLTVHLAEPVAERFGEEPFGLTLRVRVGGTEKEEPGYLGTASPRGAFEVTADDLEAAESGSAGGSTGSGGSGGSSGSGDGEGSGGSTDASGSRGPGEDRTAMRLLAVGGIGTGTLLVLVLAVWTVAARRRAAAGAVAGAVEGAVPSGRR
jgi:hypothetical protein